MTSFPVFALIVHVVTIVMIFGSGVNRKFRPGVGLIAGLVSTYIVCLVSLSDYEIYAGIYKSIDPNEPFLDQLPFLYGEPLYLLSNYVARLFSDSFYSTRFLLIFAALAIKMMFLFRFGKHHSVSIVFYMSLLFYADSYLLRSTIASSIVLIGLWALMNNRPAYQFFVPILIATGFHTSALIALPIWLFRNIVISKKLGFFILGVIVVLGIFPIGHLMVGFLATYGPSDFQAVDKLVGYANQIYGASAGIARGSLLIYVSVAIAFIGFRHQISKMTPHYDLFATIVLYSLIILVGLSDFEILSDRLFRLIAFLIAIAMGYIVACFDHSARLLVAFTAIFVLNLLPYLTDPGPFELIK